MSRSATPDEIRAMTVIATIVGGEVAFCGDQAVCSSGEIDETPAPASPYRL